MPVIRRITEALAGPLKHARLAALQEAPGAFGSTYAEERNTSEAEWKQLGAACDSETATGYLAFDGEQACGIIRAYVDANCRNRAHVTSVWVAPSYRRSGLASELLAHIEGWARAKSIDELVLTVVENNAGAISLYFREGFVRTGRTEPYPNDPVLLELEMMKKLQG